MKKRLPWFFGLLIVLFVNFTASAQVPERKGWWKFDDATNLLKADIGSPLTGSGSAVAGPSADNKAIQVPLGGYLTMVHGIAPNGGGTTVNEYTLQFDFSVPETGIWHAFFQTDPTNTSDAELFTNTSNAIGVAAEGYSSKAITADTWYRMIVSVKNGEFFKVYIDGVLWLDGPGSDIDGRFGLLSDLLIFADNDGDDGTINCSELGIWDVALDADQTAALGGANNIRVPVRTKLGWWKFDDPTNLLKAEIGKPLELGGKGEVVSVNGPTIANKAVNIGLGSYLKMIDGILPNGGGTMVNEYSIQLDFSIPATGMWYAFYQTDPTNTSDADLFIKNGDNTIGTAATTYSTNAVSANTWYRMVITVKNGEFFKVYVNGELWLDGMKQLVDGRFALADKVLLFADNDGDDAPILCSEAAIWEVALTQDEVLALGIDPTAQIPERLGLWKFDDPTNLLKASIGIDLGETGMNSAVSGPVSGNGAIEVPLGSYLTMKHGSYGNGGGIMVNEYTLQIDFSVPETGIWHTFFQTDPTNGSDGDLFTNTSNSIGTQQVTYTKNTITANTWYRMLVTVKNGEFFRIYMNGELWLDSPGQVIDDRYALADLLLLFADNDGDDGTIDCSEVAFWDVALNADQAAKLGNASTVITGIAQQTLSGNESDLAQNYPNPFSNSTIFPYQIQKAGNVSFRIFDITGKEIRVINQGALSPGKYNLEIHSEKLNNGIYFLQMKSDQGIITRKLVVAR